jgi:hypothetical protein
MGSALLSDKLIVDRVISPNFYELAVFLTAFDHLGKDKADSFGIIFVLNHAGFQAGPLLGDDHVIETAVTHTNGRVQLEYFSSGLPPADLPT